MAILTRAEAASLEARVAEIRSEIDDVKEGTALHRKLLAELAKALAALGRGEVAALVDEGGGDVLQAYRRDLLHRCSAFSLRLLDKDQADPTTGERGPDLATIYVDVDTTTLVAVRGPNKRDQGEHRPLRAIEAVGRHRCTALIGDPGSGKSLFLMHLSLCLAGDALSPSGELPATLAGWPGRGADVVPIVVVLRDFAAGLPVAIAGDPWRHLLDHIVEMLPRDDREATSRAVRAALGDGKALVLLDGLDEVSNPALRAVVRDMIVSLGSRFEKSRFVVTCRTLLYDRKAEKERKGQVRLAGFEVFEIARFDQGKIKRFIQAWYQAHVNLGRMTPEQAVALTASLQTSVRREDLRRLAPNPLLLTVMALVHAKDEELPNGRARLYERAVEILLWRWGQVKGMSLRDLLAETGNAEGDLLGVLAKLAFDVHGSTRRGDADAVADIPGQALTLALARIDPDQSLKWAAKVVDLMSTRAGLLVPREGESYGFPHRTFQEYLAGLHLSKQPDFAVRAATLLGGDTELWREVVLLGVGLLVAGDRLDALPILVGELCPARGSDDDGSWRRAWRAGEVVEEMGPSRLGRTEIGSELTRRVRTRLVDLVQRGALSAKERAEAGRVLSRLGDPRFFGRGRWCLPNELLWGFVKIDGAPFLMGSDSKDTATVFDDESPMHEVSLGAYYLQRYPVTVGQWRAYVSESGASPRDGDSLDGGDTEPVVWVYWEEAMAFCAWLDGRLRASADTPKELRVALEAGLRVTLPSEAEWERGARGRSGRVFPWGDEADPTRANYDEAGVGARSPVGCFRSGKSQDELEDMSGNVWEWTRSAYESYPYKFTSERSRVEKQGLWVLRGGSFHFEARVVRCAVRFHDVVGWSLNIGFRVALSPFSSDP